MKLHALIMCVFCAMLCVTSRPVNADMATDGIRSPQEIQLDLEKKVFWYIKNPKNLAYAVVGTSSRHVDVFAECMGAQPWSVGQMLTCCIGVCADGVGNKTYCDKQCPRMVLDTIKIHNNYVAKELSSNVTGEDRDTDITWGKSSIIGAAYAVYGRLITPKGIRSLAFSPNDLLAKEIKKINPDYVMSINELNDACENMINGLTYEQQHAMGITRTNTKCDQFVSMAIEQNNTESDYQHGFDILDVQDPMDDISDRFLYKYKTMNK